MISVIIPALNEEARIRQCLESLASGECGVEIIIADGGSLDGTRDLAASYRNVRVISSSRGRGLQMNTGAAYASGRVLLFLHADTALQQGWSGEVLSALDDRSVAGGAFTFRIKSSLPKYRLVEQWVRFRCSVFGLPYGDQGIFVRRDVFEKIGGYKDIPLMEDVDLVGRIKKAGRLVMLKKEALTSERRWARLGLVRTAATNQFVMALYLLGVSPRRLAKIYYGE